MESIDLTSCRNVNSSPGQGTETLVSGGTMGLVDATEIFQKLGNFEILKIHQVEQNVELFGMKIYWPIFAMGNNMLKFRCPKYS